MNILVFDKKMQACVYVYWQICLNQLLADSVSEYCKYIRTFDKKDNNEIYYFLFIYSNCFSSCWEFFHVKMRPLSFIRLKKNMKSFRDKFDICLSLAGLLLLSSINNGFESLGFNVLSVYLRFCLFVAAKLFTWARNIHNRYVQWDNGII